MLLFFIKIFYYLLYDLIKLKNSILLFVSILTLFLGSIGALYEINIKKIISYSTITVNGFFIYAIFNLNFILLESSLMYIFIYIIMSFLIFILLMNVFLYNNLLVKIVDFFNIYHLNKMLTFLFLILFFTLTGMPPFFIFISKFFLLKSFFFECFIGVFFLFIILLFSNFYYIRFIKNLYYRMDNNNKLLIIYNDNY